MDREKPPPFTNRLLRACVSPNAELGHRYTSPVVPESLRIRFVESMRPLILAVCASEPVREAVREPLFQWWDCFAIGDRAGQGGPAVSVLYESFPAETRLIAAVELQVLTSLLWADERLCCESALHGLNHLLHPNSADTVASFITQRREWLIGEDLLDYAVRCRDAAELGVLPIAS
jgi:hypothetical protein